MPRGSRSQPTASASTDDARERILAAAQRCIDRHGIRKTTMDDIAAEVGLSRPSVYRYFADREDLLTELNIRHARALFKRAHKSISRQTNLPDQIVESLLYIADHCHRDALTRHVIDSDGTNLGRRMIASGTLAMLRAEFWDAYLDTALADNELPHGLPSNMLYARKLNRIRAVSFHYWLGNEFG